MVFEEVLPFGIISALFDVKSVGNDFERIFILKFIKSLDIVEHGLFISNVIVELEMIVHSEGIWVVDFIEGLLLVEFHSFFVCVFLDHAFGLDVFLVMLRPNLHIFEIEYFWNVRKLRLKLMIQARLGFGLLIFYSRFQVLIGFRQLIGMLLFEIVVNF